MDVGAVKTLLGLELFAFISLFPASPVFVHPPLTGCLMVTERCRIPTGSAWMEEGKGTGIAPFLLNSLKKITFFFKENA